MTEFLNPPFRPLNLIDVINLNYSSDEYGMDSGPESSDFDDSDSDDRMLIFDIIQRNYLAQLANDFDVFELDDVGLVQLFQDDDDSMNGTFYADSDSDDSEW